MSATDKIKNAAEQAGGKLKEGVGHATDDQDLKAEGQADQVSGDLKQRGESIKDALKP